MTNLIVAESLHDEIDPQYVGKDNDSDDEDDAGQDGEDKDDFDIAKILIIHHENTLLAYFNFIDIACCLISSYAYVWLAYFGTDSETNQPFFLTLSFEIIFTLSIIFKFMTTFIEEGETMPETNHGLIY